MLKELNEAFGAVCKATSTTAQAINDGASILRIKGVAAKQTAALESIKAIKEAKDGLSNEDLEAAAELLSLIE